MFLSILEEFAEYICFMFVYKLWRKLKHGVFLGLDGSIAGVFASSMIDPRFRAQSIRHILVQT